MHRSVTEPEVFGNVFQPSLQACLAVLILMVIAAVTATWLRYEVIENAALGRACIAVTGGLRCAVQTSTIWLFNHSVIGTAALLLAAMTVWRPNALLLALAGITTIFGLFLYNTSASALACGLVILAFARPAPHIANDG